MLLRLLSFLTLHPLFSEGYHEPYPWTNVPPSHQNPTQAPPPHKKRTLVGPYFLTCYWDP